MTKSGEVLLDKADQLYAEARIHKHSREYHRRQARIKMASLAEVKEQLAALGIQFIPNTNGEGNNHGQTKTR